MAMLVNRPGDQLVLAMRKQQHNQVVVSAIIINQARQRERTGRWLRTTCWDPNTTKDQVEAHGYTLDSWELHAQTSMEPGQVGNGDPVLTCQYHYPTVNVHRHNIKNMYLVTDH